VTTTSTPGTSTDATAELRDTVASMIARIDRAPAGEWDRELLAELNRAALTWISLPEELGGPGGTLAEAAAVVRTLSRSGRATPIAELSMIAAPVAARAGLAPPAGVVTVSPARTTLDAYRDGEGYRVSGELRGVPWAQQADAILVPLRADGALLVAALPVGEVTGGRLRLATQPLGTVTLDNVRVPGDMAAQWPDPVAESPLLAFGALARATQMLGALEGALELSINHVTTREQFGRPLARFQAVQHLMAEFGSEVLVTESAVDAALAAHGTADFGDAVAVAKICAGHAVRIGAHAAHQVHAALGFTDEYPLSGLTRSMRGWRDDFGGDAFWSERFLDSVVDPDTGEVWPRLSAVGTGG